MIFHNFVSQNKYMDNSKYFDRVPEIDKAIADHQQAIKGAYLMRLQLEECRYQQAVFKACNEYTN
jgi:hypothetical protein